MENVLFNPSNVQVEQIFLKILDILIMFKLASYSLPTLSRLTLRLSCGFALPKHGLLQMPALSPTMKEGKILKWLIKEGDKVEPGDAIAQIQTDKATMAFQVQEKGYIAKINTSSDLIPIGTPVAVIAKSSQQVSQFSAYQFSSASTSTPTPKQSAPSSTSTSPPPTQKPVAKQTESKSYPQHTFLQMPAVSPTMTEGKILKWKIQPGDSFLVGDALFSIETDKAVMDYEATEKGVLAKVIVNNDQALPIGANVAVVVKSKDLVPAFSNFSNEAKPSSQPSPPTQQTATQTTQQQTTQQQTTRSDSSDKRTISSPLARTVAKQNNVDLSNLSGSGPGGRIIKQDVDTYVVGKSQQKQTQTTAAQSKTVETKPQRKVSTKTVVPQNPFQEIPLTSMRKTIANRLSESKQTIPHYYITQSIEMGAVNSLRADLNKNEKENGVKISINDIIVKAMALALRDCPNVNVQWHGNSIKRFKYSDISVAVAIEGGLITPIVHRAETLGLIEISRRTKDIAKRAREGKLDPSEYVGGTSTISNLGMYGINTVTSIINPPQATILGVGKTQKKVLPAEGRQQPYRIAEVMDIIASCDHRAVDGAMAAQWVNKIKHYLENPTHMLL